MEPEESRVGPVEIAAAELARVVNTESWEQLDDATGALQSALAVAADAEHVGALPYSILAMALYERARTTRSAVDLHASLAAARQAVLRTSFDDPARPNQLSNLGFALTTAFESIGEDSYLDEAVDASRAAVAAAPDGDTAFHLSQLGVALQLRGAHRRVPADLDEAVRVGRRAVDDATDDDPNVPGYLGNLSNSLQVRAELTADRTDLPDLDAAVAAAREAVDRQAANLPSSGLALSSLGAALLTRYQRTGRPDDLDAAVDTLEDAIRAAGPDDPATAGYQSRLAVARSWRFDLRNSGPDLNAAVEAARRAVNGAVGLIDQARYQLQLTAVLLMAGWRAGPEGDLDEVIRTAREAVESAPADHPDRAALLVNLAGTYAARYDRQEQPSDLAAAIDVGRRALLAMPDHARDRAQASANLSHVLRLRGIATDSREDVDAAVTLAETAVGRTEFGQPDLARRLAVLGEARYARFRYTGQANDFAAAESAWRQAIEDSAAPATPRLAAALCRAHALTAGDITDWHRAAAAFADAIRLLPLSAWPGLLRADQERQLADWPAVAVDAGACAAHAAEPGRAVELLDQGRTILWGHLLRFRADLRALSAVRPDLARRMDEVRRVLEFDPTQVPLFRNR